VVVMDLNRMNLILHVSVIQSCLLNWSLKKDQKGYPVVVVVVIQ
jgi:hypothetical protein